MSELLNAYDAAGNIIFAEERKSLLSKNKDYSRETGDSPNAVATIYVMLFKPDGRIYVVKRGDKPENPQKYDKTAGGHVSGDDTHEETLVRECQEEIGTDVIVAENHEEYYKLLKETDLSKYAVVRQVDFCPWLKSIRAMRDEADWVKRHRTAIYFGQYDGEVEFVDGEAVGLQLLSMEELQKWMDEDPEKFTYDLFMLLKEYAVFF